MAEKECIGNEWVNYKTYQRAIAKIFRNRKMHMWIFLFRVLNVKMLHKKGIFSIKRWIYKKDVFSFKVQIKYYTHYTVNPNICRFQRIENIFLCITFAVQYFDQKRPNDTPINYFLRENIQDNINTFDGNKTDCFVKFYTHERLRDVQSNPIDHSIKTSRFGKKNVKRQSKQINLHGSLNF